MIPKPEVIIMDDPEAGMEHGDLCFCAECLPFPKEPTDEEIAYIKEMTGAITPETEPCTTADYNPGQDRQRGAESHPANRIRP